MPYVPEDRKLVLIQKGVVEAKTAGELNFVLTQCALMYCDQQGLSYQTINDVIGAFAGAGNEFYRRIAAPYEDQKCHENGDLALYRELRGRIF